MEWDKLEPDNFFNPPRASETTSEADGVFGLKLGDQVTLSSLHPHAGKTGTVESFDKLTGLGKTGAKVRFEDGRSAFITKASHIAKPRRKRRS